MKGDRAEIRRRRPLYSFFEPTLVPLFDESDGEVSLSRFVVVSFIIASSAEANSASSFESPVPVGV